MNSPLLQQILLASKPEVPRFLVNDVQESRSIPQRQMIGSFGQVETWNPMLLGTEEEGCF